MAKKSGKYHRGSDLDVFDDFDDFDEELELKDGPRDYYGPEWGEDYDEKLDRADARRKIERRREMKRLYSELNDWEEFGLGDDWR